MFLQLSIYIKLEILIRCELGTFRSLCKTNKELFALYMNQLDEKIIKVHGNLSQRMYQERSERWFTKKIISFREESMGWNEFYKRIAFLEYQKINSIVCNWMCRFNKLMELKILIDIGYLNF